MKRYQIHFQTANDRWNAVVQAPSAGSAIASTLEYLFQSGVERSEDFKLEHLVSCDEIK